MNVDVASDDSIAHACAAHERACEEVVYTQADLVVYLQALVRQQQQLLAREVSTRKPVSAAAAPPAALRQWDVASHRPTVTHGDPTVLLGVRCSIYDGLARVRVLLARLELVFAFVFSPRFTAEALGSLRGNQATRGAWAGKGGLVPQTKPAAFGKRKRAADVAAAATAAAVAVVAAAAAAAPAATAGPAAKKRSRGAQAVAAKATAARHDGDYIGSEDGSSDSSG